MIPLRDIDELKGLMENALNFENCRAKIDELISQLGKNNPKNHAAFKGVMDVLKAVMDQGGLRINVWPTRKPPGAESLSGGSGWSWREFRKGELIATEMKTWIYVKGAYTDSQALAFDRLPYDYAVTGIHEMLHQIGKFMYSEEELDQAAEELGAEGIDDYIKKHCVPERFR